VVLSLLSITVGISTGLWVDGDAVCPQPADVAARFSALSSTPSKGHRASVTQRGPTEVELSLFDASGTLLSRRSLKAASCEGLLSATAATLFAWEATFDSTPQVVPPRAPLPAGPSAQNAPLGPVTPLSWHLDASVLAALSGRSPRPGAQVAFSLGPAGALWRGRAQLNASWPFRAPLSGGQVEWFRWAAGLGPTFRLVDEVVHVEALALFELGAVSARGIGFENNRSASALDPAFSLGAQVATDVAPTLRAFAELGARVFLVSQVAQVAGVGATLTLPPVTFELRVGVSWAR
jgi:hypothetical protein